MSIQALSIDQMKHLQEFGLDTSKASACYVVDDSKAYKPILCLSGDESEYLDATSYSVPAFILDDIIDLLPKKIKCEPLVPDFYLYINYQDMRISYAYSDKSGYTWLNPSATIENGNLIEAAYKMLCWCIERGHIKINKKEK